MDGIIILAGAGAVALAMSGDDALGEPAKVGTPSKSPSTPIPRMISEVPIIQAGRDAIGGLLDRMNAGKNQGTAGGTNPNTASGGGNYYTGADSTQTRILKELEAEAKARYEKLDAAARKRGAAAVNAELGTDLTGNESYEEASNKIGAAVGGVVAGAACAAISVGAAAPVCAILGSIVGAYLGERLGQWAKDAYDAISDWASDSYDDVKDWISSLP